MNSTESLPGGSQSARRLEYEGSYRALAVVGFVSCILFVYVMTMPMLFPPNADAIRWAQWVESSRPIWEGRHLLAWPLERTCLGLWRVFGYQGKAFIPMQVSHAALASLALGSIVWLLMVRRVHWHHAVAVGLLIGLSYTWFQYGRSAHVRIPGTAFGVFALVLTLGWPDRSLRSLWTLTAITVCSALAVLLQVHGIAFVLIVAVIVSLRARGRPSLRVAYGAGMAFTALALVLLTYAGVWYSAIQHTDSPTFVRWVFEHPETRALDAGPSLKQGLRAGVGITRAFGGESEVVKVAKARLFGPDSAQPNARPADWIALLAGIIALIIGCAATGICAISPSMRVDGIAAALSLLILGGFGLLWTGSDAWLWLAPVAFLWYAVGLWITRGALTRPRTAVVLGFALALSLVGAYRAIEAPCLLTKKSKPTVRSAIAYAQNTQPQDLAIGFYGWTNWLDYGLDRERVYLYHLSFGRDWRQDLVNGLKQVPSSGRVFVTADVVEPTDVDTMETWDRVAKANNMARPEVLHLLRQQGELVRIDVMLPDEPIWELKRKHL